MILGNNFSTDQWPWVGVCADHCLQWTSVTELSRSTLLCSAGVRGQWRDLSQSINTLSQSGSLISWRTVSVFSCNWSDSLALFCLRLETENLYFRSKTRSMLWRFILITDCLLLRAGPESISLVWGQYPLRSNDVSWSRLLHIQHCSLHWQEVVPLF